MSFETFIALRYLRAKKAYRFLSFFSVVALLGISISVFSFVVIESVMNGFTSYMKGVLIGFNAHVTLSVPAILPRDSLLDWLKDQKGIESITVVSELDGILSHSAEMGGGAKIRGISPDGITANSHLNLYFFGDRTLADLDRANAVPGILIGEDLFSRLKFVPGEEALCTLIYPFGEVGPSGELQPRRRDFQIVGVFSTGFYETDSRYVFVADHQAKKLAGEGTPVEKILIRLKHSDQALNIAKKISQHFPETHPLTWGEKNKRLFSALKLEGMGMFLLLSIVTFMACFTILGLVTLLATNKTREVAVLKALGANEKEIRQIFLKIGLILGLGGMVLGVSTGAIAVALLAHYPLPLPPAYYLEVLPVKPNLVVIGLFSLMAPLFGWMAATWPARRALRFNTADILRMT